MKKIAVREPVINRRKWFGAAVSGGVTAAVWTAGSIGASTERPAASPNSAKNIQLSLAAYSVRKALTSGKMDLFGFIDWCAELGLPGTELTSYYFREGFDSAYLRELRRRAFKQGVTISGTAIRNDFCRPPGPEKEREVAQVKRWIDHAAELFAPHIRIFAGDIPEGTEKKTAIQWTADGIKAVLDKAAERGITIGLENHGGITELATDLLAICKAVGDHPWFGVNLDTGNFHSDPYGELAMVAPRAVNVQIKVEMSGPDGKSFPADLAKVRDVVVNSGYKGWVALEYEAERDPFEEIPRYLKELRRLFVQE